MWSPPPPAIWRRWTLAARLQGKPVPDFTQKTAIGALGYYISDPSVKNFQPMNINFGILEPLGYRVKGKANKNLADMSKRALETLDALLETGI